MNIQSYSSVIHSSIFYFFIGFISIMREKGKERKIKQSPKIVQEETIVRDR
jgi:hypothetical protein